MLGHSSPPNSDGSYNSYRCEHLGTGRVSSFNVRDIIPYISVEAYEQEKSRAVQFNSDEEEEEKEEFKEDPDFDPKVGDFLLFPNFGDVPYHLVRVTGRPFDDAVAFSYFGVSKQNKKRLVGFQQVVGDAFESTELAIFTLWVFVLIFTCKCIKSWGWPEERRYRVRYGIVYTVRTSDYIHIFI